MKMLLQVDLAPVDRRSGPQAGHRVGRRGRFRGSARGRLRDLERPRGKAGGGDQGRHTERQMVRPMQKSQHNMFGMRA